MAMITLIFVMDKSYTAIIGLISAFIHEIGHLIAIYLTKGKIKQVTFGLINVDIVKEDYTLNSNIKNELLIFSSGPLINFIIALIFGFLNTTNNSELYKLISYQNIFLGIVNLLPINSLDGGKILESILSRKLEYNLSERILSITSFIFLVPLCTLGILVLIKSKYNFSLLILGCYLISYILIGENNLK